MNPVTLAWREITVQNVTLPTHILLESNLLTDWLFGPDGLSGTGQAGLVLGSILIAGLLWRRRHFIGDEYRWRPDALTQSPLRSEDLPPPAACYFGLHQPKLEEIGFDSIGDYRMIDGRRPLYARYFANAESDVYAELVFRRTTGLRGGPQSAARAMTLVTVFDDGTCLQTTNLRGREDRRFCPPQMIYKFRPNMGADSLCAEHDAAVAEYADAHETAAVRYPPDQIVEVAAHYAQHQRDFWQEKGLIGAPTMRSPQPD